eukprot:1108308-Pyramimonas_sp.AAC.1
MGARWPQPAQGGVDSLSEASCRSIGDASPIPGRCVPPFASPPPMVASQSRPRAEGAQGP